MLNNQETNIIWIYENIQSEENNLYVQELINLGYQKVNPFKQIEESISYINGFFLKVQKLLLMAIYLLIL